MTEAVNGVVAGQVLWFPNGGMRIDNGTTDTSANAPGQCGDYWAYSNGYILQFFSGASTGRSVVSSTKLYGQSVRCVR